MADLFLSGLGDPEPLLALAVCLPLSLDPDLDLLLAGGDGDILLRGASTPSAATVLDSNKSRLAPGKAPVSLSLSGFRGPGLPLPSLLDFFLVFLLSSLSLLLLESELESLLDSLELSLLELELELLAFLL